jgi:hypothetical protein
MNPAASPRVFEQLATTIDLWLCMWEPHEQTAFETALVRAMTDAHPLHIRRLAFAACNVIATPRLCAAATRFAERGLISAHEVSAIESQTLRLYKRHDAALRLRGNVARVEHLLRQVVTGTAVPSEAEVLDWIDVRVLVTVARTAVDARLFGEIERRIARRGKYQRARAANVLGFHVRPASLASTSSISGG